MGKATTINVNSKQRERYRRLQKKTGLEGGVFFDRLLKLAERDPNELVAISTQNNGSATDGNSDRSAR